MRRQPGSALVFVLIIVAGIVTVTIGAQRLSLVQFNQATREEDNLFAYYAAKSGIEDGLLRFRYQRNVEIEASKVHRFDITDGISYGEINAAQAITTVSNYNAAHQYYDAAISFKTDQIGDFNFTNNPPRLEQDAELQLTGFPNSTIYTDNYFLRYAFKFIGSDCRAKGAFVQLQEIVTSPSGQTTYTQRQAVVGANNLVDSRGDNLPIATGANLSSFVRIRPYYCPIQYAFTTATSANGANGGPQFDALQTKITATGYFGKTKRTLQAQIDRKSGTLINIYDFNLYSGEGSIQPGN